MTDHTEPEDTCRPVEIDGELIRVRGAAELSSEGQEALTSIIRAAKAKMAAEPIPVRQQLRAHAFNAVAPALKRHDEWLRLTVRRTIADAVLAAVEEFLDIGDAEAWCKTCRRVWDGKQHRCEGDAEARLAHLQATSEAAGRLLTRESDRASQTEQRLLDMTLNRDQLQAALNRVRALAADLERGSWTGPAIARRIHEALDQP